MQHERKSRNQQNTKVVAAPFAETKLQPHSTEVEKIVLGTILMIPDAIITAGETLTPEHFYHENHQIIFQAALDLDKRGQKVDIMTMVQKLADIGKLEQVGNPYYITKLTNDVVSSAHFEHHIAILEEKYFLRKFVEAGLTLYDTAMNTNDCVLVAQLAESLLQRVADKMNISRSDKFENIVFNRAQTILTNDGSITPGIPTQFPSLDEKLLGFLEQLYIVAARPSMGKTALMVEWVKSIASSKLAQLVKRGEELVVELLPVPVGVIELESSKDAFSDRLLANVSGIDTKALKKGGLTDKDKERVSNATSLIMSWPIYSAFDPMLEFSSLSRKIRNWVKKYGVKIVFIDYLQIINVGTEDEKLTRERQVAKMSQQLAALATELGIAIIAFAQLSREVLKRSGNRPTLGDLRESGGIEAAARVVMFIHRPEYYGEVEDELGNSLKGITELIIAKNNEGDLGTIKLHFDGRYSKYEDYGAVDANGLWKPVDIPDANFDQF